MPKIINICVYIVMIILNLICIESLYAQVIKNDFLFSKNQPIYIEADELYHNQNTQITYAKGNAILQNKDQIVMDALR